MTKHIEGFLNKSEGLFQVVCNLNKVYQALNFQSSSNKAVFWENMSKQIFTIQLRSIAKFIKRFLKNNQITRSNQIFF